MNGKADERVRRVERDFEGTRLEAEALAQAYEQIEPSAAQELFRRAARRGQATARRFAHGPLAQGGERCRQ
jgi:hypothetical protein